MTDVSGIPAFGINAPILGISPGLQFAQDTTAQTNQFNQQQAALNTQSQKVFDQFVYDAQNKGPASNYGKVFIGPSFGEAGNYGGQNDPFSGSYAPGNMGYSGRAVGDIWSQGAPAFQYGGTADIDWMKAGSQGPRPSTTVWAEGAPAFEYGGLADIDWMKAGSQGDRPSDIWSHNSPDYNSFGGPADTAWAQSGSQGDRPSSTWNYNAPDYAYGGAADTDWAKGGSMGLRPSDLWADAWDTTLADPRNTYGGIYDQDWVKRGSQGFRPSSVADWGDTHDQDWVRGGSMGIQPSLISGWGGRDDQDWYSKGSEGLRPSVANALGEIGNTDFSSQNRNIWGAGASSFDDYGQLYSGETGDASATGNYDAFKNTTYREPWIAAIPEKFRTNEAVEAMQEVARQWGWNPAALANVIQMETKHSRVAGSKGINPESLWNTLTTTGKYHGLTQMDPDTFKEAPGGRLNGLTYEEYKRASPAQQIRTYGAWVAHYARNNPGSAADLVGGGIGSLPVEDQAAIMMGTQFGPNAKRWVSALGEGNENVQTHHKQAPELKPWTISAMRDAMARQMAAWPQTQSPWPLR